MSQQRKSSWLSLFKRHKREPGSHASPHHSSSSSSAQRRNSCPPVVHIAPSSSLPASQRSSPTLLAHSSRRSDSVKSLNVTTTTRRSVNMQQTTCTHRTGATTDQQHSSSPSRSSQISQESITETGAEQPTAALDKPFWQAKLSSTTQLALQWFPTISMWLVVLWLLSLTMATFLHRPATGVHGQSKASHLSKQDTFVLGQLVGEASALATWNALAGEAQAPASIKRLEEALENTLLQAKRLLDLPPDALLTATALAKAGSLLNQVDDLNLVRRVLLRASLPPAVDDPFHP
eukprot:m.71901 g.71901  ORF g.71901 m.71901 type:complete len:291 (-) comp12318_c0_seq1:335-1207(-)